MLLQSCAPQEANKKLLELLPVSKTHVDFSNRIVEDDSFNILNFMYLYNGAGVGVADLNNDGFTDLFFAGNQVSNKLYLNKGNFEFTEVSKEAGIMSGAWCTGVSMVDINQDGWMDIYVSVAHPIPHHSAPNLMYLNQGTNDLEIPEFIEGIDAAGRDGAQIVH